MLSTFLNDLINLNSRLKAIRDYPIREDRFGICRLVNVEHKYICRGLWVYWEHYSGVPNFPVPSSAMSPEKAYWKCKRWSKKSKYGQMRFKLLDYLIEQTDLKIKELS